MKKREIEDGDVLLKKGVDMTIPKFIEWLNDTFKKSSNKPFTAQDAYGYIKRRNLPFHFGMYRVTEKDYKEMGIKVVRVVSYEEKRDE